MSDETLSELVDCNRLASRDAGNSNAGAKCASIVPLTGHDCATGYCGAESTNAAAFVPLEGTRLNHDAVESVNSPAEAN